MTTVTVVGYSGSVAGPEAAGSCYLVERDGFVLVLDMGSGSISPLQRLVDVRRLDAVVISHAHHDHWADLNQLAYLRARAGAPPLPVIAPSDLPPDLDFPGQLSISRASAGRIECGPMTLTLAAVEHATETWGVRVDDALCYSADTAPCPAHDVLAAGCRSILAEASGFDDDEHRGHLSAGDAGRLAARSHVGLLVLTHLRFWHDSAALLAEAASYADCPVLTAATGLRFCA